MCGIAGSIGPRFVDEGRIDRALASMARRGPDAQGRWRGEVAGHKVTLLHTRLAIIDLEPRANQPFLWDDCVLVYNGEIYNFSELRAELESLGHRFSTDSDTEVVLHAYREWADDCFDRFEGMWAIVLADLRAQRLVMSRDRFGEKPLYLWRHKDALYFASEVKTLAALAGEAPTVDIGQVRRYLVNGYRALYKRPTTFFREVQEFPAASCAHLTTPGLPRAERYWRLDFAPREMSLRDAVVGTRERLRRTVELRLRSDVPLAFCLSGGVDSSALASIAVRDLGREVHAFSIIDRDERYNETRNIRATVTDLGCTLHEIHTTSEGFLDRLAAQIAYHDAPVATISYYVHAFLSEAIAEAGFKVAVSGTGADEVFTGYYDHYGFWLAEMHDAENFGELVADWRRGYGAHVRNPVLRDPLTFCRNPAERGHIYQNRELFNSLLREPIEETFEETDYSASLLRKRMMNELFHEVVPVILHEDDRNSMRWSVENRSPYLDRALVEFLYTVPNRLLIRDGCAKWLLRAAVEGRLNDRVRLDRQKRGFNASIDSLLDRRNPEVVERLLAPGPIFDIVRRDAVARFLEGDLTDNSFSKFAFSFVSAKLFLESDLAAGRVQRLAA